MSAMTKTEVEQLANLAIPTLRNVSTFEIIDDRDGWNLFTIEDGLAAFVISCVI